jgi:glycosidase
MKKNIILLFTLFTITLHAQTVPVTFHLDANNTQYQTVKMSSGPTYNYTDDDGDRIFELTLNLQPGKFDYVVLRDEAWGLDPDNPFNNGQNASEQATMTISDPMISYLLPKDKDMMRENRIQADFAYTSNNSPLTNTISVKINGNSIANPSQYFDATKRRLFIANPPNLVNGSNTVTVAYSTNKGSISRSSTFTYQPIELMIDTMVYRMDHILGWGRVFQKPYPASVYLRCNDKTYTTNVNSEGYFGADISILNGANQVKVAYSEADLNNPVDQMTVHAEVRHKWWVELTGSISGSTATIQTISHDINQSELTFFWSQSEENPTAFSVSGSSPNLTFTVPTQKGNYEVELHVTAANGEDYVARKMLTTEGSPHFIEVNERAPWMETMVLYEVETDFIDWPNYTFQKMKQTFQHMKDLGVNTFRITPFVSGGFISWDHFQIRSSNGSIEDLKDMVKTAHQYGLKVLFDIPLSHTAPFHPFILPNFLLKDKAEPYYHFSLWKGNPGESDIVNDPNNGRQCVYTNLDNSYTQEYFTRLMEYWVEVAGADGFRIDCGEQSLLRSPNYIKELHKRLRNINPNLFILEEGDNRNTPGVNYYNFGDATYDWKLNGWNNNEGFSGIFSGTYSVNQFHELLTTGTPDKGLVMRYINVGYFDYFSKRFGTEQERSGVSIINTTYGLPNIRAGEEVGLARASGMIDFSDPNKVMPFYTRLIKARKGLLGNYPVIERITQNIPANVYAYTSKSNGKIVLTVVNFSASQTSVTLNLENAVFENKGKTNWYNITDDVTINNTGKTNLTVAMAPWKAEVFALDYTKEEVFPGASSITLITTTGETSIETDRESLHFIASVLPTNSMDKIVWKLEGDTLLASLSDGTLTACGCGEGQVIVVASSAINPSIKAQMAISISNQVSGQVTNSTFNSNVDNWHLWSPDCNNTYSWDNGEARVTYANGNTECWSQFMGNYDMKIETGKSYRVSFDARASENKNLDCVVREGGNNYEWLSNEASFQLTTQMQLFSYEFTAGKASNIAQIQFNMGAKNADFWFDNVSFCEKVESNEMVDVTFQVDMKNNEVSSAGVYLNGSFCNWNAGNAKKLTANGTVFSSTLQLKKGETIEYKFVNGAADDWAKYEIIAGQTCAYGNDANRMLVVPNNDVTLDLVCFNSCSACVPPIVSDSVNITFRVDMQNETVASGVYLRGSFNDWSSTEPLENDGSVYFKTIELTPGDTIEYKFVNGEQWEDGIPDDCTVGDNNDRQLIVPQNDVSLDLVCFNSCEACPILNNYTINANSSPSEGGTISGAGTYESGTLVKLSAKANFGYEFVNWTSADTVYSTQSVLVFGLYNNLNLVAHFKEIVSEKFTITTSFTPSESGTVTGAGTYDAGTFVTITATPNDGYTFVNWTLKGVEVSTAASYTFTIDKSAAYLAHFTNSTNPVELTFQVDMQNEKVASRVYLRGSFNDWNSTEPLENDGSIYFKTMELTPGETVEYKFVNGEQWEDGIPSECSYGNTGNRQLVVPDEDSTLEIVCFDYCESCIPTMVEESNLYTIRSTPNPTNGLITLSGLPYNEILIRVYSGDGRLIVEKTTGYSDTDQIDISKFNSGIYYFILLQEERLIQAIKVVRK